MKKLISTVALLLVATTINAKSVVMTIESYDNTSKLMVGCTQYKKLLLILDTKLSYPTLATKKTVPVMSVSTNMYPAGTTHLFIPASSNQFILEGNDAKEYILDIIRESQSKDKLDVYWHLGIMDEAAEKNHAFNINDAPGKFGYVLGYCDGVNR